MRRIRTEIAYGLKIKAVMLSYMETELNVFDNTFSRITTFYTQNKLMQKTTTFRYHPENDTKEVLGYKIETLAENCTIPEADKMLQE